MKFPNQFNHSSPKNSVDGNSYHRTSLESTQWSRPSKPSWITLSVVYAPLILISPFSFGASYCCRCRTPWICYEKQGVTCQNQHMRNENCTWLPVQSVGTSWWQSNTILTSKHPNLMGPTRHWCMLSWSHKRTSSLLLLSCFRNKKILSLWSTQIFSKHCKIPEETESQENVRIATEIFYNIKKLNKVSKTRKNKTTNVGTKRSSNNF